MNVDFAIELIGFGAIFPFAISGVIVWLTRRYLPADAAVRYSAALALAAAFFVGYALLPSWAPLRPTRHWQWLPYLGLAAMVVGALGLAKGISTVERWMLYLLLALTTAWLLVPSWPDLQPSRNVYITAFTSALVLLTVLLDPLPSRVGEPLFLLWLAIVAFTAAIVLAVFVSVKFGQITGIAAAATGGCCAASFLIGGECGSRGLVPVWTVIVGGTVFVGHVEPNPPLTALLLIPAAPLGLWASEVGPLARLRGYAAGAVRIAAVVILLIIAVVVLILQERSLDDEAMYSQESYLACSSNLSRPSQLRGRHVCRVARGGCQANYPHRERL